MSKRIYFAHCMADYNKPRERRAMQLLRRKMPGWRILNPNSKRVAKAFDRNSHDPMAYWRGLVRGCDALAYLVNPDGSVGTGVAVEILEAVAWGKPVYRIDANCANNFAFSKIDGGRLPRVLSIEQTRALIKEAA